MRHTRWTFALPALALLLAGCDGADRDAYAGNAPEDEEMATERTTPTMGAEETARGDLEIDLDGSGDIDETEYDAWWNENSAGLRWDTDGDEQLTRDEYYGGIASRLDSDGDGRITQQEWQDRTDNIWGDATPPEWSTIDTDGDGAATTAEVRQAMESSDLYAQVDENSDEAVDDEELGNWFRGVFDLNDDGRIDSSEWNPANWFDGR